jgi:arylsulfatase
MFLNYMDAHEPYNPDTEYLSKFRDAPCSVDVDWHLKSLGHTHSDSELDCINDLYDACLNYLDYQISLLFDGLEDRGILDETVVVLTADHGKCLGEHGYLGVGTYLYDELVEIPLIISHHGESESYLPAEYISQIDVHSMILQTAGIETEWRPIDGVISETLGPHQDVDKGDHYVPKEGLQRIDHRGYTLIENQHTEQEQPPDNTPEDVRKEMTNLMQEQKQNRRSLSTQSTAKQINDDVKRHLEELGYR